MQEGDIITRIEDVPIDESHSFINALFAYTPGQEITLEIVRERQTLTVQVTLGETRTGN